MKPTRKAETAVIEAGKHNIGIGYTAMQPVAAATLATLATLIHEANVLQGFWPEERNDGECIALMHSELSEALEALRHGNPDSEKCPAHSQLAEELADCIIRILDYCAARELDIGHAIMDKLMYNLQRPLKHGKGF